MRSRPKPRRTRAQKIRSQRRQLKQVLTWLVFQQHARDVAQWSGRSKTLLDYVADLKVALARMAYVIVHAPPDVRKARLERLYRRPA